MGELSWPLPTIQRDLVIYIFFSNRPVVNPIDVRVDTHPSWQSMLVAVAVQRAGRRGKREESGQKRGVSMYIVPPFEFVRQRGGIPRRFYR